MTDMTAEQVLKDFIDGTGIRRCRDFESGFLHGYAEGRTLTAPRVPERWLPIETAPMDGTAVLVMRDIWPGTKTGRAEECNEHNTYVAAWWSGEGKGGEWVCYMNAVLDPVCPITPTHWMPLPQPPSMLTAAPSPAESGRSAIEQAHMAGQADAGVDPSYSNARLYSDKTVTGEGDLAGSSLCDFLKNTPMDSAERDAELGWCGSG